MKLVGKKEQSYASLDISESPQAAPIRRSSSKFLNVQLSPSAVSTTSISSDDSSRAFPRQGRRDSMEDSVQPFYNTVATDVLAALDGPIRQLAFETKGALLATGLAATLYLLTWFQAVLIPFFLAVFLMYLVDPLVEMIDVSPKYFLCICTSRGRHARRKSRGCSRALASLVAVSVVCVFFGLLGYITVLSVHALDTSAYQTGYNLLVSQVEHILERLGLPVNITTTLHDNVDKLARVVVTETMDLLSVMFVTLIYLTYFLCTRTRASDAGGVWSKIDHDIQRFVTLKCFLSLFVALLVTIVYVWLNVGLAIVWGILTFILNWIPNVGAMIASVVPVCIIAITPSEMMNHMEKFMAVFLPMCFHMFVGNFVEPKVFGRKLEIDPVIVILSLSAWGLLWGVVGMMLSVPLTAAAKIMLSHLKLWPEFVALVEGTYFTRFGNKAARYQKQEENDKEEFETMQVRTESEQDRASGGHMRI
uniref:Transmembrane protein n=1 Tax=Peronospora matthiolae TaxID=2874970 RepID=A0AAV1UXK1_9STRA